MRRLPFHLFFIIPATALAGPNFGERVIDAGFDVEQPVLIANLTDGDDRSDLVIRYNATDGVGAAHTVRLLITKP